jgi:glucosamine 6-phosphate synthetase-like amidotransferase/phosphosugar isomerase protein
VDTDLCKDSDCNFLKAFPYIMCGIVACFAIEERAAQAKDVLTAQLEDALSTIAYRGPDSSGTFVTKNGRVGETKKPYMP